MPILHDPIFGSYLKAVMGVLAVAGGILAVLTFVLRKDVRSIWLTYRGWLIMAPLFLDYVANRRIVGRGVAN